MENALLKEEEREEQLLQSLRKIIEKRDADELSAFFDELNPVDFARAASELDDDELKKLSPLLDDDELASLMEESEDDDRIRIARTLDNHRLLTAFEYMQKDDIVDMLGDFPIGRRKDVINLMKADDRRIINTLLQYPEDSAGGLMTTAYIALRNTLTVSAGLEKIREIGPKTEVIETIFIINDKRQLIGFCDLRDLLTAPKSRLLSSIMNENVITVQPEADQEETARLVSKYDLTALPVVSRTNQILGIITVDDVIDVIVEEYDEDILQMAGVSKEEKIDTTLGESIRMRLPWLLINLVTAFLASWVVKLFEDTISQVVALSAIMTIVSGMGGNAGTQTMSILVREISQKHLKFSDCVRPFLKEIALGVIDGAATGGVTAAVVCAVYGNLFLGLITLLAMIGNLVIAGVFGFLVPVFLEKIHADPAIASSIFVTTATDVLGFFIFLGLAEVFLRYLT
ncbi:MAG: magnesium transporter [Bilifractor sp.]|jgi:magnesium transporter